ncbi:glycerol kinase GlpK [Paenibacillus arenilitoris]|uniref:ATP:glycerol 3-phosphotransferase n=1 Tax=Paenibacillus arenilitoris TaxID=2772299 RepID=A0A927CFA6_9BACL|nr:glycerol kinase GlpK [Paenibacillus arenilitoris]MBD2867013.1 glycerol kinase GlpK [Paenibacillus arenilitoris]
MEKHIVAIDQSTAGTKALVVDRYGRVVAKSSADHRQIYPRPGWVEHDPLEIYENVKRTMREALRQASLTAADLAAISITNQRETAVVWDGETGLPVHNAIVWQCQRTADRCSELRAAGGERDVQTKTGLRLDPYFSAAKWGWILRDTENAGSLLRQGRLLAGTIDSWLIWKLTGGRTHATDYTNASRTSLFNIHTLAWDEELCRLFGVPPALLPEVKFSDDLYGHTADPDLFAEQVPICGVIGDSQAALFGQLCLEPGEAKATYGTGTSVLMNIGERPAAPGSGLVTAVAWGRDGKVTYALEAIIRSTGDTVKWARESLGLFDSFEELDDMLRRTPDNEGVYLVPAFVGMGAPYWDPYARAAITGMSRAAGRAHIVRAAVESIAYQVRDAADLMEKESGIPLVRLNADGGASVNPLLMQFQADMLGLPVLKSEVAELSAMGSVYMAGLGVEYWSSLDEIVRMSRQGRQYTPMIEAAERERLYEGWRRAVAAVLSGTSGTGC